MEENVEERHVVPVTLTFDDGCISQYNDVFPIIEKYGINASFYVITNKIGKRKYMDYAHLKELFFNNNEIGSHTHNHYNLNNVEYKEIDFELNNSKKILSKFECSTIAYPFGSYNDNVLNIVKKYYLAGRGYYNEKIQNYDYGYNDKKNNVFKLKSIPTEIKIPSYDESILIMEENKFYKTIMNIIKYIYENKLWLIFVFHFNRYFLHNVRSYLFNKNKEKKYYDKYMLKNFGLLCQILSNEPKIELNNLKEVIRKYYL